MLYNSNIDPLLLTQNAMGFSTTTSLQNKIKRKNCISQHTSVTAEYSASVTDNVIIFLICEHNVMTTPLSRTLYPATIYQVSLYTT